MSKNKSVYDVLLQRTLSRLLNLSQALHTAKVTIQVSKVPYKLLLPTAQENLVRVIVRVSDKGNIKIKATLNKQIKTLIGVEVRNAMDEMIHSNDSPADYSKVKAKLWKLYRRKVTTDLSSRIIRSSLSTFNWNK